MLSRRRLAALASTLALNFMTAAPTCHAQGALEVPLQAGVAPRLVIDDELERRVLRLTEELRCLVCQNQTIADSHADLALDLKAQVREKLAQGQSDQQILDFMVERYGDFVLYRPPVKGSTVALWLGPILLLLSSLGGLFVKLRANRVAFEEAPTEAELAHAARLLADQPAAKDCS